MALDYRRCAEEIFACLGGKDNIASVAHCATRLRLAIADSRKVDEKRLENVEGVKGVFTSNGQLQCIIGTGTVNKVFDEFIKVSGLQAGTKDDVKAAAAANMNVFKRMIKTLGDVFVPILPAIVASGLLMGIVESLGKAIPGFGATDWYSFLDMVANTAFAYLPVIVAISSARVFGGNIFLGAVVGLAMIHSALTNGWNAADGYSIWYLFGHLEIGGYTLGQVNVLGYQGHVIPVMISVFLMCQIEKRLHKIVPEMLDLFITPLTTVFVTLLLTFTVVGPIFSSLETIVLSATQTLITIGHGAGAFVMGAIYPVTVVMGLHHMYNVIEAGLLASADFGNLNIWMPVATAANFAQFGACLAVGVKAKSKRTKAIAIPSALSASLGITEPAIFGVNLRYTKPFVCAMVGAAAGAMFGAWTGLGATAYGVTGIPGFLTINHPLIYTILLAISGGVAFALTMAVWKENPDEIASEKPVPETTPSVEKAVTETAALPTEPVLSTEKGGILQPVKGELISACDIKDPMFAAEGMGPSVGIRPAEGKVYAPCDGEITMLFPTNHAVGITSKEGMEVLIHVGIDTVNMAGKGFTSRVQQNAQVESGQLLLEFDREEILRAGYDDTVIVALTNGAEYKEVKKVR